MRTLAALLLAAPALLAATPLPAEDALQPGDTRQHEMEDTEVETGMTPGDEMSALVEAGFAHALEAIQEARVYPFAIVRREGPEGDEEFSTRLIGFQGTPEEAPPAEEWQQFLYHHLRELAADDPRIRSMALIRQHELEPEEGGLLPAIWALSDHREADQPTITVVPMVPEDEEAQTYRIGDPLYQRTDQRLFPEEGQE